MSKLNQYGFSSQMNPKLKKLLSAYNPADRSHITAMRNKKLLWSLNTVRKEKLRGHTEELTSQETVNVVMTILVSIILLWALFNL